MKDFDRFMVQLKEIVDAHQGRMYEAHGPLRVYYTRLLDSKHKERKTVRVESGWDENYGGTVTVEASPTGRSVTVYVSPEVRVERQ